MVHITSCDLCRRIKKKVRFRKLELKFYILGMQLQVSPLYINIYFYSWSVTDFVPVSRVVLCVGSNVIPSVFQVVYLHFSDNVNRVDDDDYDFSVKTGI
jgi:hypothetical protein